MTAFTQEDVISRLQEIIDPCSAATKVPLSIVEMGMVENVELASGNVAVDLRMTSPVCYPMTYLPKAGRRAAGGTPCIWRGKRTCATRGESETSHMSVHARP